MSTKSKDEDVVAQGLFAALEGGITQSTRGEGGNRKQRGGEHGWEDNDGEIPDGLCEAVGVGWCNVVQRTFSRGIRYSTATTDAAEDDNRGGTAPPTPPSTATL